jgi:hypothetical protein
MDHYPMRAYIHLVAKGVPHMPNGNTGHLGKEDQFEGTDIVAILFS